jgi:hypothetical protein
VVTNDGHRLGHIKEVGQHYVERDTLHLSIAGSGVDAMGWGRPSRTSDALHTGPERDVDRDI